MTVQDGAGRAAVAGPVLVVESEEALAPRPGEAARTILWGDCHGHSTVGDGTHPPAHYFFYARDVAHLDYTCLSEHDWQQFLGVGLDQEEGAWDRVADLAREWRRPGFAVLLGWEWSSRVHGHRVVLFPDDGTRYVSYQNVPSPAELAEALRGTGAFSILAHPSGSHLTPALEWDTVVPGFDRAVEIYSGHGTMDGDPDYRPPSEPRPGRSAVDAIRRGHRLAFVGFSDTHLSTPGNPWPPAIRDAPYRGGLTAVWAPAAEERAVFDALKRGLCYATSGERFLVDFRVEDRLLGETLELGGGRPVRVTGVAAARVRLARVEVMGGDAVIEPLDASGRAEISFSIEIGPFEEETAVWLRGESEEGERFWTTPVWVVPSASRP
jgi:hypothetical protein